MNKNRNELELIPEEKICPAPAATNIVHIRHNDTTDVKRGKYRICNKKSATVSHGINSAQAVLCKDVPPLWQSVNAGETHGARKGVMEDTGHITI